MEVKGARYDKITNLMFLANALLLAKMINEVSPGTFNRADIISYILTDKFVSMILLSLLCYLALFIIPSNWKERIVFFDPKGMPGYYVFSKLIHKDFRINEALIKEKYPQIPNEGKDQNAFWYTIYRKVENDEMVKKSHDDRLIARDMTVISFLFLLIGIITFIYLASSFDKNIKYLILFLFEYMLTNISTRVLSSRFVLNAIVADISK